MAAPLLTKPITLCFSAHGSLVHTVSRFTLAGEADTSSLHNSSDLEAAPTTSRQQHDSDTPLIHGCNTLISTAPTTWTEVLADFSISGLPSLLPLPKPPTVPSTLSELVVATVAPNPPSVSHLLLTQHFRRAITLSIPTPTPVSSLTPSPLPDPTAAALTSAPGALQDFPLHKYTQTSGAVAAHGSPARQRKGEHVPLGTGGKSSPVSPCTHSLHPPLQGTVAPPSLSTMCMPPSSPPPPPILTDPAAALAAPSL